MILALFSGMPLTAYPQRRQVANLINVRAASGHVAGVVQRTQKARLAVKQFGHGLLIPQMIAAGDDINAGGKKFARDGRRDAVAAGGVLAVGDDEIQRVFLAQARQDGFDGLAPRFAHDVADEENFHGEI